MAKLDKAFFYDRQLANRNTSVRLYADDDSGNPQLIARAILQSGYGYSINNNWGESGSIIDTLVNLGIGFMNSIKGPNATLLVDGVNGMLSLFGTDLNKLTGVDVKQYLNANFYSLANKVKSFGGTEVSLNGTDNVTFYLISDREGVDIMKQVNTLLKQSIGDELETPDLVKDWVGVQGSPNNYQWSYDSLNMNNKHIPKTLRLFIGNFLIIDNLLVQNMDVKFSTQTVMEKAGEIKYDENLSGMFIYGKPSNKPLSATVEMRFTYARMLTNRDLARIFINQNSKASDIDSNYFGQNNETAISTFTSVKETDFPPKT